MRLLNTTTLQFSEFVDVIPSYAILSHRWGSNEVSYVEFLAGHKTDTSGHLKILEACCMVAGDYDLDWVWIDTCCINKDSSAELSEAINSMYRWYQNAELCLAYLNDVPSKPMESSGPHYEAFLNSFRMSEWFTRGWTLQELLAPKELIFVSGQWQPIGTKHEYAALVSKATNIDSDAIMSFSLTEWSVASRMSWASTRHTTRVEDEAYCMLGLFGINIPLLYGEGRKAFQRLQEEIVRTVDDETIFAWSIYESQTPLVSELSLFASRPADFAECGNIFQKVYDERQPYSLTNRGLLIDVVLLPHDDDDTYVVPLNCHIRSRSGWERQLVLLIITLLQGRNIYARKQCTDMMSAGFKNPIGGLHTQKWTTLFLQQMSISEFDYIDDRRRSRKRMTMYHRKKEQMRDRLALVNKGTGERSMIEPEDLLMLSTTSQDKAEEVGEQTLRKCEQVFGIDNESTLGIAYTLGLLYDRTGKKQEAKDLYLRALQGFQKIGGKHQQTGRIIGRKLQNLTSASDATEPK